MVRVHPLHELFKKVELQARGLDTSIPGLSGVVATPVIQGLGGELGPSPLQTTRNDAYPHLLPGTSVPFTMLKSGGRWLSRVLHISRAFSSTLAPQSK